jgi:hypothetical protein
MFIDVFKARMEKYRDREGVSDIEDLCLQGRVRAAAADESST